MQIVADENVPFVESAFSRLGHVRTLAGRKITSKDLSDADILLVRSVTQVDRELLNGSNVRFVGSATIGQDHVDTDYLLEAGIAFANAPGCNATAASEYTIAAALTLATHHSIQLKGRTATIIGCGHVGSRVLKKLTALGMNCQVYDPPLQRAGGSGTFVSLPQALKADLITCHVPLTATGDDSSYHLLNAERIAAINEGSLLINCARGSVIDNQALSAALRKKKLHTALDVWEGEPVINQLLLDQVDLATPHIAGYSLDGRVAGTEMIYRAVCQYLGVSQEWKASNVLPEIDQPELELDQNSPAEMLIENAVKQVYDIMADDGRMRQAAARGGKFFDRLRKTYPVRREFHQYCICIDGLDSETQKQLAALEFQFY